MVRSIKGKLRAGGPTLTLSKLRPYVGHLLEGKKVGEEGGKGGDLTRNPQPADGGERELRQLFVRLGGRKEEGGVCMAFGSPATHHHSSFFPDLGVGRPLLWRHAPLLTPLILSAMPPTASASHHHPWVHTLTWSLPRSPYLP